MRIRFRKLLVVVAALALLAAACGDDDSGEATGSSPTDGQTDGNANANTETEAEVGDPFKIGLIVELTGNLGFLGQSSEKAVEIAVEQLNEEGGRPFELVKCDTESKPEVAVSCYDRLVRRDNVDALVGPGLTPNAEAIADRTDRDKIFNYVLGGSYGQYDMFGHRYQFGAHTVTEDVMAAIWRWGESEGYEDAYMISSSDATGDACRRFFDDEQWAEDAARLELLGQSEMDISAQTAAPQLATVPPDADMVILCVAGGAGVVAMVSYEQSGLQMPAVTLHSNGVPFIAQALTGKVEDDTVFVPSFCVLAAAQDQLEEGFACSERANQFVETFRANYPDAEPDILGAAAYDAVLQIAEAVDATDGSSDALVEYLESLDAWPGAAGVYSYGPDRHRGLGPESVLMGVFRDGNWELADMIQVPKA